MVAVHGLCPAASSTTITFCCLARQCSTGFEVGSGMTHLCGDGIGATASTGAQSDDPGML